MEACSICKDAHTISELNLIPSYDDSVLLCMKCNNVFLNRWDTVFAPILGHMRKSRGAVFRDYLKDFLRKGGWKYCGFESTFCRDKDEESSNPDCDDNCSDESSDESYHTESSEEEESSDESIEESSDSESSNEPQCVDVDVVEK
jgi:hypothetical protein